jgi:hypothetical protein
MAQSKNRNLIVSRKLTALSRVLLENLIVTQLVKKFAAFYGTRRFIAVFITTRRCSLSWARFSQFTPSHPVSPRSIFLFFCVTFSNKLFFCSEELLAPRQTPKLEDHPLSAVCYCLFNIFAVTLRTWRPSRPSEIWCRACCADRVTNPF